ncbi:hypothetical protein FOL47_003299 [Perkinsus chesapeaki]|uniref:Uncharacterized protein n=1 Tax=Perkinsus chesapeaki TaxID=330153 RepID=A0A7J6N3V2_PERCH|nr:hypothetical protein FOL47_003299 [Perkinsus chesapeaki]
MARRPSDLAGDLVFQEGKKVEGEYYIVSVYDDPEVSRIHFAAYELEKDLTYTLTYTYSDFDELFRQAVSSFELMNPNNTDARYHWVIERLDFVVQDYLGNKVLCLAPEPTAIGEVDMVDEAKPSKGSSSETQKNSTHDSAAPHAEGSKLDPALRQQLQKELLKMDESGLHVNMMKSEGVRKQFLADVQSKRQLEQLKAEQRLIKLDEDRATRLAKMQLENKLMQQKALKYKAESTNRTQLVGELEKLMKKKQQEEVRRLLREKMAAEKDRQIRTENAQGRQQFKESRLREQRARELERKVTLDARRAEVNLQRANMLKQISKKIADERQRQIDIQTRHTQHLAELRKKRIQTLELECHDRAVAKEDKESAWERVEESRVNNEATRERYRRQRERKRVIEDVKEASLREEAEREAANKLRREEKLEAARSAARERAREKERLAAVEASRQRNTELKLENRQRRVREQAWLKETQQSAVDSFLFPESAGDDPGEDVESPVDNGPELESKAAEDPACPERKRFVDDIRREDRRKERNVSNEKHEQDARATLQKSMKYREMEEVRRLQAWKAEELERREKNAAVRFDRERTRDENARAARSKKVLDYEVAKRLEQARRQKENEREALRNTELRTRIRSLPSGLAVPPLIA